MPDQRIVFVDTSILDKMVGLDGDDAFAEAETEFRARQLAGQRLVIPVTAIIETGNHIAQSAGDRRRYAEGLIAVIRAAQRADPPWIIRAVTWDGRFLEELISGDSTGSTLISLLGDGRMGTGDLAILVERDRFRSSSAYTQFEVWSGDAELRAYGAPD